MKSMCGHSGAPRMCLCVGGVGACGMWNILQVNWSTASMRSSGGRGARVREAARGVQRCDGGELRARVGAW